jgi:ethanolamine ammonia-lyase large subunit
MPNPYTVPLIVDETDVANVKKAVETKVENTNADKTPIIMQKIAASKKDTKQFGTMLVAGSIGIGAGYLVAKKMGLNAMLFATLSGLALAGATMVMSNK